MGVFTQFISSNDVFVVVFLFARSQVFGFRNVTLFLSFVSFFAEFSFFFDPSLVGHSNVSPFDVVVCVCLVNLDTLFVQL